MDQLTSAQLSEWEAYDKLDPIGTWREDYRLAYLSSVLTNIALSQSGEKDESKYKVPMDFMLDWDLTDEKTKEPKKQSTEEMKRVLLGIAASQNKKVKRVREKAPPKNIPTKRKES